MWITTNKKTSTRNFGMLRQLPAGRYAGGLW